MSDLNLAYLARGPPTDHLFFFFKCILKPLLRYSIHTQVVLVVKNPPANAGDIRSLGWEDPLKEGTTTHSSILAWRIPRTEEPGRLQPMGSQELDTT